MKKIISISILALYLFSCTEFDQLLKVPLLVVHFIEHKQESKDISFGEFMLIHYVQGYSLNGDYEQDTNLPFKSIDDSTIQVIDFITLLNPCLKVKPIYTEDKRFKPFDQLFIDNAYLSSIWQPPRLTVFSNQLSAAIIC